MREGNPTCLIVDPARQFGSRRDQLFSDLTARAFARAGWNVVWVVDRDDILTDQPYADIRKILPSTPLATIGPTVAAQTRWATVGGWQAKSALPSIRGFGAQSVARLARWLGWRIYECSGWLRWAVNQAIHFSRWPTAKSPSWTSQSAGALERQGGRATARVDRSELCDLIKRCSPHDVVVFPAAEIVQIEALFGLIPELQLERPLQTTLHARFATFERMQVSRGGDDIPTLGARLKSGSPFRSVFLHCDGVERAEQMARDLGVPVHTLPDWSESGGDIFLLRSLAPSTATVGDSHANATVPSVVVEAFGPVVLLVSALWGRVGSCTIFDAQTRFLIDRGCIVVRALVEHHPSFGAKRIKRTSTFLSEMFDEVRPHLHFVAYRDRGFRGLSDLAVSAEFRRASPVRRIGLLLADAKAHNHAGLSWCAERAAFAVVNHLPHVEFTSRLTSAPLILETHDIYSKLLCTHGVPRFVPPGPDGLDLRVAEEKAVWRSVAACVNLAPADHKIIENYAAVAVLARPYVARRESTRRSWNEVIAANRLPDEFRTTNEFDLMLWGSCHDGNVRSIRWFLDVIANDQRLKGVKILVAGRVILRLPNRLRRRENLHMVDHVDRLEDFVSRSRVLVIPDQDGTGTSIKAIDALALGCCFTSTQAGFRGIDIADTSYLPSVDASELLNDIAALLASRRMRDERASIARRLYGLNFSKESFRSAWDTVLSAVVPQLQQQHRSMAEQDQEVEQTDQPTERAQHLAVDFVPPCNQADGASPMPKAETMAARIPRLSVVVCTYNRYDVLPDAVGSLLKQDCKPDLLEIIVIDNSPDQVAAEAFSQRYGSEARLRYVLEPVPGLSNARNLGTSLARADLVAFIDDDAIAAPDWSSHIVRAFEATVKRASIVGGRVLPRWLGARPRWLGNELLKFLSVIDWGGTLRELPAHQWLAGCNIAFDKKVLTAVGGFSRGLGRIGSGSSLLSNDETDVMDKIRAAGHVALYCPEAVVEHVIDPSRLTHDWFRRRAAWQAVSDFIKDPERATGYAPAAAEHMRLLHKDGSSDVPMGFFRRVENPDEFQRDIGLIYDVVVATLAGGAEIDPADDQGVAAAFKAKAVGRLRKITLSNPRVRQILRLALRSRGLLRRA